MQSLNNSSFGQSQPQGVPSSHDIDNIKLTTMNLNNQMMEMKRAMMMMQNDSRQKDDQIIKLNTDLTDKNKNGRTSQLNIQNYQDQHNFEQKLGQLNEENEQLTKENKQMRKKVESQKKQF